MGRPAVRLVRPLDADGRDADDGSTDVEVLALPVTPGPGAGDRAVLGDAARQSLAALGRAGVPGDLVAAARSVLALEEASGRPGTVHGLPLPPPDAGDGPRLLLLAGVGAASASDLRRAGAAVARRARRATSLRSELLTAAEAAAATPSEAVRAHVEGLLLASYTFSRRGRPDEDAAVRLSRVDVLAAGPAAEEALAQGEAVADATAFTRDLVNTPAAEATPAWLAEQASALPAVVAGRDTGRVHVDVLAGDDLVSAGLGGVVAVGAGSAQPPCLVQARWEPALRDGRRVPHVVLVGKGITFDTGGLSLKPPDGMTTMKTDMAGGATVLGVLRAVAELALPVRLTVLVPAAENMPSGSATRPGDVVTHRGGLTSEVLNTDAEGRLVLADALALAVETLEPDALVDVATLTGAVRVALGTRTAGLFTPDDALAAELQEASRTAGEPLWRLPLVEDYRPALHSDVADLRNVGDPELHLGGGSITAALFLQAFTAGARWAHLDVAGAARSSEVRDEVTKGGSGWGVRLLVRWVESHAAAPADSA